MVKPLVSVIIPAYGHAEFILETLDSVFRQSFVDYEIIVVNDGSPDNTAEALDSLISKGKIRYYEQSNSGVAAARNFGIAQAMGKYIGFLDDDDLWPPEKLKWQVNLLESREVIAVGGNALPMLGDQFLDGSKNDDREELLEAHNFFGGSQFHSPGQVLIRKDALIKVGGLDNAIWGADDLDLWIRLARSGRIIRRHSPALFYRIHDTNASRATERMFINTDKVFRKHLDGSFGTHLQKCRRKGYRWLFDYFGRDLLRMALCVSGGERIKIQTRFATVGLIIYVFFPRLTSDPLLGIIITRACGRYLFETLRSKLSALWNTSILVL